MPDMTRDEMIEGLLHEITRTHCHLEDTDRDLCVVADDLDELMKTLEPSTAELLAPFARGLQSEPSWGIDGYSVTDSPRYRIFASPSGPRTSQEDVRRVGGVR